jgi:glutamate dehydrogenase
MAWPSPTASGSGTPSPPAARRATTTRRWAITARGAWEAVKRHFRELGKDIQSEPFTVVGCGDMSGDVFGNGMLLSEQTRLLAAFDHRHIFLDPDPDPAKSYAERQRMFELPRSSWDDYDRRAVSKGGGVFARTLKSIPLTRDVKAMLGVSADSLSPADLINAILKAPAELLYLGGIGTYVKGQRESHAEVGDKANDAIRVNAGDLRVKVVGEGANLGLTQAGRIEFALHGGRVNTDAIDNSAGVDSSDHEVNIKILTGMLERTDVLNRAKRDKLLKSMTEDVASHVLAHNYDQTLALSLMDLDSVGELEPHAQYMTHLESRGQLDRSVEGLPDINVLAERRQAAKGLTRPEEAVLLAYGKLELKGDMAHSPVADDPYFEDLLEGYFPKALRKYDEALRRHRLRREIIATVVANDAINRCGPSFPTRLMSAASCDVTAFVTAYEAAKAVLDLPRLWDEVSALDGLAPAAGQMALYRRLAYTLRGETFWLARRAARGGQGVEALVKRYKPGAATLKKLLPDVLSPVERERLDAQVARLTAAGAPEALAREVAHLQPLTVAVDLVDLADASNWSLVSAARLYQQVGRTFAFDRLREAAGGFTAGDAFERTAVRRLVEDLLAEQASVTRAVMGLADGKRAGENEEAAQAAIASWTDSRRESADAARKAVEEIEAAGGAWSFAKLTIANAALRELANAEGK